jgi:5-methylcytosine-specific restriction endonuclease McrA
MAQGRQAEAHMTARNSSQRDRDRAALARSRPACAICGQPIDYSLRWLEGEHGAKCRRPDCTGCVPHPMRFEADHIVPLAKGGTDTLANKQATHRKCNSTKRARIVAPIVRRSGSLDW